MSDETQMKDADQSGEIKVASTRLMMARSIARALWLPGFKAANPGADKEKIAEAWKAVRHAQAKPVVEALRALEKKGFTFSYPVAPTGEDA